MSFIEITNLEKIYRIPHKGKITALAGVNIRIEKGEFISLVGPSGAGKSTLIRLLIREEAPTNGKIMIAGRDITALKSNQLPYYRRKLGVIFQDFKLLPQKTVFENIAFALEVCETPRKDIRDKVLKILEMVNLSARASNYPHELSGGEKQRVAIARSLVHSPQIVIADEPTGNLDPVNAKEIIDILLRINKAGAVVLLATHNEEIVNNLSRRVITMKAGKVALDEKIGKYRIV